ncbi:acyltransferase family protein [Brevibacterium jeotgali]|uniref:acyltransferase family protein n=1 Tax=Brevibacterium jeotgali TaxID=1262550 RepID=UPI0015E0D29A|nr:acyltransferase family protein [Brevibacterium jeotgali]
MRDSRLDIAKGVLILLVVFGHLLPRIGLDDGLTNLAYTVIYAFHMPAFIFLAGITARSTRLIERIATFVILLIAFQALYYVAERRIGDPFAWSWTDPHWIMWFLLALIWWTLTVPFIERFPRTLVAVSAVVGICAGVLPFAGSELSISRSLVFWPFFVVGKVYGAKLFALTADLPLWTRVSGCAVAFLPLLALFVAGTDAGWLYGSGNFDHLEVSDPRGILIRACLTLIAFLAILALLAAVPDMRGPLTVIGERSLSVYLLHGFLIIALTPALAEFFSGGYGHAVQIGAVVISGFAAGGIAFALSSKPVHWIVSTPPKRAAAAIASLLTPRERAHTPPDPARNAR